MRKLLFCGVGTLFSLFAGAQCPDASFTATSSVCIEEQVVLTNNSSSVDTYAWDFCEGGLSATPTATDLGSVSGVNTPFGLETVLSGDNYYSFVANTNAGTLLRLDHGTDYTMAPTVVDLGNFSNNLSSPIALSIREVSGEWIAFVGDANNGLIRLNFGSDVTSTDPDITVFNSLTEFNAIQPVRDLDLVFEGGEYKLLTVGINSAGTVAIHNFGSTPGTEASPTESSFDITGSNAMSGLAVFSDCNNWYATVLDFTDGIYRVDFGASITSTVTTSTISGVSSGVKMETMHDKGHWYGLVTSSGSDQLYRVDFGSDLTTDVPSVSTIGSLSELNRAQAFSIIRDSSEVSMLGINRSSGELIHVDFPVTCAGSLTYSTDETPTGFSYSASDTYSIYLTGTSTDGDGISMEEQTVTVTSDTAPSISFDTDTNQCTDVSNTFTANPSSGLTYTWDFNGEGAGNTGEETFQFTTAGTKTITLTVSDGTCTNEVSDELTVYDPPAAADFDFNVASQCTNNEISFQNLTVDTGIEEVIGYTWDFNGEGSSNDEDPTFTFTTAGTKTIGLQAFIPGCTTTVYSEDILIAEGPDAQFDYSGNCGVGELITFTNETTGVNITGYSWDFGDGGSTSTDENPTFSYAVAGDYTVGLTVTNATGCSTLFTRVIDVTDDSRATFTFSDSEQNVSVPFTGVDTTPADDEVTNWSWDFAGLGNSTDQSPSFTFNDAGAFNITLTVTTSQGCEEEVVQTINISEACPVASFTATASVCLEEQVVLTNNSTTVSTYAWDFCEGGLSETPTATDLGSVTGANTPFGMETVVSGDNYYSFVANTNAGTLLRLDHGTDYSVAPTVMDLGNFSNNLSSPIALTIREVAGDWIAFVGDADNGLIRLNFGSDLTSTDPAITVFNSLTEFNAVQPVRDLDLVHEAGEYKLLTAGINSSGTVAIHNFGSSPGTESSPTESSFDIAGAEAMSGLAVLSDCENWYALVLDFNDGIYQVDFGASITSTVTTSTVSGVSSGVKVETMHDKGNWYGLVTSSGSDQLYRIDFGSDLTTDVPNVSTIGSLSELSRAQAFSIIRDSSEVSMLGINRSSGELIHLDFPVTCAGSLTFSTDETPTGFSYDVSNTYSIYLTGTSANGDGISMTSQSVTVTGDTAPSISFSTDSNQCTDVSNTFTANPSTGLNYTWDFNGEGAGNAGEETFQFTTAGTKTVTLTVSDGTCTNEISNELIVYDPPTAADFDFSATFQCTNNEISFQNLTVDTGIEEVIGYLWDFNGEGSSSLEDPTFTFTTAGTKTIGLQAFIPGCTTTVYTEDIVIAEGPAAQFSFTGNCGLGETITFTNETTGSNITGYSWDFGDGGSTSTDENPTFTYADAGDYTVSLTVTNATGCATTISNDLTVTDDSRATFTFSDAEQNTSVPFTGVDTSPTGDEVTSWSWDFAGLGSSTDQSPTFTFTDVGSYDITLMVMTSQGCEEEIVQSITVSEACPVVAFEATSSVCIDEQVLLTNNSTTVSTYAWDFCEGGLSATPTATDLGIITAANTPFGMETVMSGGNYYSFVANTNAGTLLRLDHGEDYRVTPTVVDLGNFSDNLSSPIALSIREVSGEWIVFVGDADNGLIRLNFGTDLTSTSPTVTVFNSLAEFNAIQPVRDLDLVYEAGEYKLVSVGINSLGTVAIHNFGSSPGSENEPVGSSFDITGAESMSGLAVLSDCENWYALVLDFNEGLFQVNFGESITSTVTTSTIDGISSGVKVETMHDKGNWYGLVASSGSDQLYRVDFGSDLTSDVPEVTVIGSLNELSRAQAFSVFRDSSEVSMLGINQSVGELIHLEFPVTCSGSLSYSTDETPTGFSYSTSDTHTIYLTGTSSNGDGISMTEQSVTVSTDVAPTISFATSDSRCIDNSNTFTASSTAFNYSWDFNGEGSGTTAEEVFQFTTTGDKTITLTVDNGTCTNTVEETITIYEAPPVPVFEVSGNVCESTSLEITNSTEDADWSDAISYIWTFDEDSMVTANQPNFAFTVSGNRSISVISSIPGCSSEAASASIAVNDLPGTDYSISPTCDQEVTNFTNLTTGASSYSWDFGDGFTSTQTSPSHLYQAAGDYTVSMVATNDTGCSDTLTQVFSVDFLPVAGFRAQLPCEGSINLIDTSSVAASDVIAWSYSIEGIEQLFSDQNPQFALDEPGDYEVTQQVTSNEGCRSTVTQTISVQDAADAAMQIDAACFGDSFHFTDISTISTDNRVISRIWNFEGQNVEVSDTSIVDIDHTFSLPGNYDVTLTLTTQNLCTSTITRSIEVLEPPVLDFDIPQICQNDFATFTDLSTSANDDIVSRQWVLNGALIGNGTSVSHKFTVDGANDIWLVTTTAQGCIDTLPRSVNVLSAPQAAFEASSNFGIEGSTFSFENTSTGSETYQWLVDGQSASTETDFEVTFDASGNREVSLIAFSEFSCADTTTLDVLVRVPEIDVVLTGMRLVPDDRNPQFSKIQVSVENRSNLPVEGLQFIVEIDDSPVQSTENIFVPIGDSRSTELGVGVPIQATYICVEVLAVYDSEDIEPGNNSRCINIEPAPVFPPIYPNPARDEVSVDAVLPTEGDVTISLLDLSGKVEIQETYSNLNEGLQSFKLEISPYEPGMYFIKIEFGSFVEIKRIVKQ